MLLMMLMVLLMLMMMVVYKLMWNWNGLEHVMSGYGTG